MMNINEVLDNLCTRDTRHPDYHDSYNDDDEQPIARLNCYCDNCFYARDKLALYILELLGEATTNDRQPLNNLTH